MFDLLKPRQAAIMLVALAVLLISPTPVFASDGCSIIGFIFGSDCFSSLSDGVTERTEVRQDGETSRVEIRQENITERTQIEADQARIEAEQETARQLETQRQMTERERIAADALRHAASEQTTQVLAAALARQNSTQALVNAAQIVTLIDAKENILLKQMEEEAKLARTEMIARTLDRLAVIAIFAAIFSIAYANRKRKASSPQSLPQSVAWTVRNDQRASYRYREPERSEIVAYDEAKL